jgi:hypothetical protein
MIGAIKIRQYMRQEIEDHRDPVTGEVCPTGLAEDACQHFDDYGPGPDFEIPEVYFECAHEISEIDEARRKGTTCQAVRGLIGSRDSSHF